MDRVPGKSCRPLADDLTLRAMLVANYRKYRNLLIFKMTPIRLRDSVFKTGWPSRTGETERKEERPKNGIPWLTSVSNFFLFLSTYEMFLFGTVVHFRAWTDSWITRHSLFQYVRLQKWRFSVAYYHHLKWNDFIKYRTTCFKFEINQIN